VLDLAERYGLAREIVIGKEIASNVAALKGGHQESEGTYCEALRLAPQLGDKSDLVVEILQRSANSALRLHGTELAFERTREAVHIAGAIGDWWGLGVSLRGSDRRMVSAMKWVRPELHWRSQERH